MTRQRVRKLEGLLRLTQTLYNVEAMKVADVNRRQAELENGARQAESFLDESADHGAFLNELALLRSARIRKAIGENGKLLARQLDAAASTLGGLKGAEKQLKDAMTGNARVMEGRALEEVVDLASRLRKQV